MEVESLYLSLGGNLGDRIASIENAYQLIEERIGRIAAKSSLYQTPPWGFSADQDFINTCIEVHTTLEVEKILEEIEKIEQDLGRISKSQGENYSSRKIDIDIILLSNRIIDNPSLQIPHKRYHQRRFVLQPLREIAPNALDPRTGKTIEEIYALCSDESSIKIYKG